MTPHVSVVLPVRDGARWVGEALASVLAQTLADWELIVVDDGSADDTPGIIHEFAQRDARIRPLRQDALGLVTALNVALAEVRAPLMARLDADDRAMPNRLERQAQYMADHPEVGLLGSWAWQIEEDGRQRRPLRPPTSTEALTEELRQRNPFVHSSVMLRTELARRLGGFRPAFRAAEDYDLWLRISEAAAIEILPEELAEYRRHGENVTSRDSIRQAFSVRLAQDSARARRRTGRDPADALRVPPDWRCGDADTSFFSDDAALYRLLDLADPEAPSERFTDADFSLIEARLHDLNFNERALAALAMINHMRNAERSHARRTRRHFFRLLSGWPLTVPRKALWRLPGALVR